MGEAFAAAMVGFGVLAALWLAFGFWLGLAWPLRVADGADGRPSTSKFQFLLWTAVIVWGYAAVAARRSIDETSLGDIGIPSNLFILMGLGAGTALAAKLVTVGRGGRPALADVRTRTYRSLIADDDGKAALEKIQVLAWTLVAAGAFIVSVWQIIAARATPSSLPNVDDALLVLLGIGQFAYVGVKMLPRPQEPAAASGGVRRAIVAAPPAPSATPSETSTVRDSL